MRKGKLVQKAVVELDDVVCDRCNKSCLEELDNVEAAVVEATWGYGSDKDGQKWHAELCSTCSDELRAWIDQGAGPGLRVEEYMGEYNPDGLLERINHYANEDLGISGEEFLKRMKADDDFSQYPERAANRAYFAARAYLHYLEAAKS